MEWRKIYHARLMHARSFIDSLDFAGNNQEISSEVAVAKLARLLDVLDNPQGVLRYAIQGGVDRQGCYFLDVSVTGQCQLRCQRCLGALDYPLQIDTRLLLRDQASLDRLDEAEEEFDSILADQYLDVLNLLEEEILLSLPIAPKHEAGTCQAAARNDSQQEEKHPFAVLAKLKRN